MIARKGSRSLNRSTLVGVIWLSLIAVLSAGTSVAAGELDDPGRRLSFEEVRAQVAESYDFHGMAGYYEGVEVLLIVEGRVVEAEAAREIVLGPQDWLIVKGRFKVFALRWPDAAVEFGDGSFEISPPPGSLEGREIVLTSKDELPAEYPELDQLRYLHLGRLIGGLARVMEWSMAEIHRLGVGNWGLVIVVFSLLLKLVLLPLGVLAVRQQGIVSQIKAELAPRLDEIKAKHDGEEAHKRIMAAHRDLGISPFYTLKPLLTNLVQVPILIAIFNVLGEMPQLGGAGFLWIDDLAYPDSLARLGWSLPFLGDRLNLLPILMTAITIFSTIGYRDLHASAAQLRAHRRNYLMIAAVFFILFYPFPASMVLFWTLVNLLQYAQQRLVGP